MRIGVEAVAYITFKNGQTARLRIGKYKRIETFVNYWLFRSDFQNCKLYDKNTFEKIGFFGVNKKTNQIYHSFNF